jgi:hypothetical protein
MEAIVPETTSPSLKLSDSQLVILSAAAQRGDGSLLPFPQSLSIKGAALGKVVKTLCKRKLVEERKAINGAPEWRRDDDRPLGLFITNAGLLALGIEDVEKTKPAQPAASVPRQRKTAAAKPRRMEKKISPSARQKRRATAPQSKQDLVIQMLRRQSGVTVEDIVTTTGWQPHSVRGFLSGLVKRKLKLPLVSDVGKDGVRRYRIAPLKSAKA